MNATGVTLTWEALIGVLGVLGAVGGYIVLHVRNEAKREYQIQAQTERADELDKLFKEFRQEYTHRMNQAQREIQETRKVLLANQAIITRIETEMTRFTKLLDDWWKR